MMHVPTKLQQFLIIRFFSFCTDIHTGTTLKTRFIFLDSDAGNK